MWCGAWQMPRCETTLSIKAGPHQTPQPRRLCPVSSSWLFLGVTCAHPSIPLCDPWGRAAPKKGAGEGAGARWQLVRGSQCQLWLRTRCHTGHGPASSVRCWNESLRRNKITELKKRNPLRSNKKNRIFTPPCLLIYPWSRAILHIYILILQAPAEYLLL